MLKSLLKFLLFSTILGLIIVFSLLYFLPSIIPEEQVRTSIESFGSDINSEIKISGKTSFTILPSPSVTIKNISIKHNEDVRFFDSLHIKISLRSIAQQDLNFFVDMKNKNGHLAGNILLPKAQKAIESDDANLSIDLTQPIKLSLTAKLYEDGSLIKLSDAKFSLTKTIAEGNFESTQNGEVTNISSNINFAKFDINELKSLQKIPAIFTPEPTLKPTDIEISSSPNKWSKSPIDFSWINNLRINANINLQEIISNGFESGAAKINLELKEDKIFRITLNESSIYDGKGGGYIKIDNSGDTPIISKKYVFDGVEIGNLLGDISNYRQISAKGGFLIETSSSGNSLDEIMRNLSGKGLVNVSGGKFKGFDSAKLADAENISHAFEDKQKITDIMGFDASFTIENGVLKNDDMKLQIPFSQLSGEGIIDLYNQSVNYTITPNIGISNIGLKVPVKIKGDLKNPKYKADIKGLVIKNVDQLELLDKKQIKKTLQDSGEIINKLGKGLGLDLKGVLNKALPKKENPEATN